MPRLGVALGSGSARGWAHIGVLQVMAELGLRPQIISGSSIGALVGAAAAADKLRALQDWVTGLDWWDILRYAVQPTGAGLADGVRLMDAYTEQLGEWRIEDLPVRFAAVATDLGTGREVWIQEGEACEAVRASIALPGLFAPVRREGRWLVDGGIVDPVPVSLCRALGAEVVVAVNLNHYILQRFDRPQSRALGRKYFVGRLGEQLQRALGVSVPGLPTAVDAEAEANTVPGMFEVLAGSMYIMQDRITRSRMAGDPPELLINPPLQDVAMMDHHRAAEVIEVGRQAAKGALDGLLAQYPELCESRSADGGG
jgi:NTE family protein